MAIHMVTPIAGVEFRITLSRDEAGNYVAEAARNRTEGAEAPRVRVVDAKKERALTGLFDSLRRLSDDSAGSGSPEDPDFRPAA